MRSSSLPSSNRAHLFRRRTRLQALLLLTLLSLPITFQPDLPKKGRKKKNPEKYSETLDPSMLLDFLTDRMQIWRVMKDVSEIDVAGLGDTQEGEANEKVQKEEERDTIQRWWQDVVEPLYVFSLYSLFSS